MDYTEAIRLDPKHVEAFYYRGFAWDAMKKYDNAIQDYSEAIRLDPKYVSVNNSLAWLLSTCPEAKYRDGLRAVEVALEACELSSWNPMYVDTLAAACAETGDFEQAVKYQKQALASPAFPKTEIEPGRQRLKLYEAKKPFRE